MTIHETPIMRLCDRVRNAFWGMELSLRHTSSAIGSGNDLLAVSELMDLANHCRCVLVAINDFCMDIDREKRCD